MAHDARELYAELHAQLRLHDPETFPVQHATASFHLGTVLANEGAVDDARAAFEVAAELFAGRLPVEHAKALNALGATARLAGRPGLAVEEFERAEAAFREAGQQLEQGAACFNRGLALFDAGRQGEAIACWREARLLLDPARVPAQAGAVARELGGVLLQRGELEQAIELLREAEQLAERGDDVAGLGAATNALGLALLAAGDVEAAVVAFERAVAAHPRSVRPVDFAMVKANLAQAYARLERPRRARLAARQALVAEAPEEVVAQAEALLSRLGEDPDDLPCVLEQETADRWAALVRDELHRLLEAPAAEQVTAARHWIAAIHAREETGAGIDLLEAWLGVLLELPPAQMEQLLDAAAAALDGSDEAAADTFRMGFARAAIRFHPPQAARLEHAFAAATERLDAVQWS